MLKVYLNRRLLADQPLGLEDFELTIEREDGIANTEQILREKVESELIFIGDGYSLICNKRRSNFCEDILCTIIFECEAEGISDQIFEGYIQQKNTVIDPHKCHATVSPIKDNSFSALIRDYISTDIGLYYTKSINCMDIPTVEQTYTFSTDPDDITNSLVYKRGFDVLDVLQYYVNYITDGRINVVSDFLTATTLGDVRFAITTGFNLHNTTGSLVQTHPLLSIERLFNELRKKLHIYMGIEYDTAGNPYLRIEQESYFFDTTTNILTIDEVPVGTTEKLDTGRLFNEIEVGSEDTDVEIGDIYYPQNPLTAWEKEKYTNCGGCPGDKDSKLNLVSDFIIDSNMIYEALQIPAGDEYAHDDDIYLFWYYIDVDTEERIAFIANNPPFNENIYNENIINETVLGNWVGLGSNCVASTRSAQNGFSVVSNGQTQIAQLGVAIPGDYYTQKGFDGVIVYDNQGNVTQNDVTASNPYTDRVPPIAFVDNAKVFTVSSNGDYNFRASSTYVNCSEDEIITPALLEYLLKISVYSDNTFTTLLSEYTDTQLGTDGSGYIRSAVSMSIETGMIPLSVGNTVYVKMMTNIASLTPDPIFVCENNTVFQLIEDDQSCENIDDLNGAYPYIVSTERDICYSDWQAMTATKRGYIDLNGKTYFIKKASWNPNTKIMRADLLGRDTICEACNDVPCETTECGTVSLIDAAYNTVDDQLNVCVDVSSLTECDAVSKIQVLLERSEDGVAWTEVPIPDDEFEVIEGEQQISIDITLSQYQGAGVPIFYRLSIRSYCPLTFWTEYSDTVDVGFNTSGGCGI